MKTSMPDQIVKRVDHVVWKVIDGKGILLNLENGSYFEVDPVGLAIWQKCDGKNSLLKISESIAESFDVKLDRVMRDSIEFVRDLKKKQMVEVEA